MLGSISKWNNYAAQRKLVPMLPCSLNQLKAKLSVPSVVISMYRLFDYRHWIRFSSNINAGITAKSFVDVIKSASQRHEQWMTVERKQKKKPNVYGTNESPERSVPKCSKEVSYLAPLRWQSCSNKECGAS